MEGTSVEDSTKNAVEREEWNGRIQLKIFFKLWGSLEEGEIKQWKENALCNHVSKINDNS